jgi:hypothetical protein
MNIVSMMLALVNVLSANDYFVIIFGVEVDERDKRAPLIRANRAGLRNSGNLIAGGQEIGTSSLITADLPSCMGVKTLAISRSITLMSCSFRYSSESSLALAPFL